MGYNINFRSPVKVASDDTVTVLGSSEPLPDAKLVSRHVILRQGIVNAEGSAAPVKPGEDAWTTQPLTPNGGTFATGEDAVAFGTETHVPDDTLSQSPLATVITVSWSQIVQIA
jgi:hypothetical protein